MLSPRGAAFLVCAVRVGGVPFTGEPVELETLGLLRQRRAMCAMPVVDRIAECRIPLEKKRSHVSVERKRSTYLAREERPKLVR